MYYAYNRVEVILQKLQIMCRKLVPTRPVAFAHGQMAEHELENIMYDFINGDIDAGVNNDY